MKRFGFCRLIRPALLAAIAPVALSACTTTNLPDAPKTIAAPTKANPHYKIGAPYQIDGRWYTPKVDERYEEVGIASWYGDQFHGKLTANGEIFDKRRLSAAHKTLPLPTLAEVENLENGRRIIVRINDRGPFVGDRVIDLSHAAADELGFSSKGLAKVRVRYVGETDVAGVAAKPGESVSAATRVAVSRDAIAPTNASSVETRDRLGELIASSTGEAAPARTPRAIPDLWVELTSVDNLDAIASMKLDLPELGPVVVQAGESGGRRVQFLRIGPFIDEAIAVASLSRVKAAGFGDARIIHGPRS